MRAIIGATVLCALAFSASARPAAGCSCAPRPPCDAFRDADAVFIGRADVTPLASGAQRTKFEVEESFRGSSGGHVEIVSRGIGGSCEYGFVDATRYIVFARRAPDGSWKASLCGSTAPLTEAGEAITFARGPARDVRRGGSVKGHRDQGPGACVFHPVTAVKRPPR